MSTLNEAWIIDALRSPVGRYGGMLKDTRPDDLAAHVIKALLGTHWCACAGYQRRLHGLYEPGR